MKKYQILFSLLLVVSLTCANWALAQGPLSRGIDVVDALGVSNDGSADASEIINRAIRRAEGRPILLPAGTYLLRSSIEPVTGTILRIAPRAVLQRGFDAGNGATGALINSPTQGPVSDVLIEGGEFINPDNAYSGRVINAVGNNWRIRNVQIKSWGKAGHPSVAVAVFGHQTEIIGLKVQGSPAEDHHAGLRVFAGTGIRVRDALIHSGGDCFLAAPPETRDRFGAGFPVHDVLFERCQGVSKLGRVFVAGHLTPQPVLDRQSLNSVEVRDIRFVDCAGETLQPRRSHAPVFLVTNGNPRAAAFAGQINFIRSRGKAPTQANEVALVVSRSGGNVEGVLFDQVQFVGAGRPLRAENPVLDVRELGSVRGGEWTAIPVLD